MQKNPGKTKQKQKNDKQTKIQTTPKHGGGEIRKQKQLREISLASGVKALSIFQKQKCAFYLHRNYTWVTG